MNTKYYALIGFLVVATSSSTLSFAKSATQITCREFIQMDDVTQPKIVYWMDGFDRRGNVGADMIDFNGNDKLVPILVQECTKNPEHLLAKKLKVVHKAANL